MALLNTLFRLRTFLHQIAIQQQRLRATWDYDQVKSAYSESMQQTNELKIQLDAATGERERQDRLIKELSTKLSEPSDTVKSYSIL